MGAVLVLGTIVIFIIAYVTYGKYLAREWGVDISRKTPAHEMEDGIDYVPASVPVLLGHHFSSIAGAGPIVGPISAAIFGWVPVVLWIILGSIFFGGVHDFGSMFASVRNKGRSIGNIIETSVGSFEKKLFNIFSWLTLILVIAAFANIIVNTFISIPEVATTSLLFIVLAVAYGFLTNMFKPPLVLSTILGIIGLVICIWLGNLFPLTMSRYFWFAFLMAYIFIASIAPVWILLQPRDYLNSFLLYAMLLGGALGVLIFRPSIVGPAFGGFVAPNGQWLFPMLFITVACGAVSGFHSLVSSGTSSKQVSSEGDMLKVAYGSMLIEGVLAVIALVTAIYITQGELTSLLTGEGGSPTTVFATGLAHFMESFGIPFKYGQSFIALAVSAFALTTLDTATRIARFIWQETFMKNDTIDESNFLSNKYFATFVTVAIGGIFGLTSWSTVWPVFGSANQLLAAIALLAVAVWLHKSGRKNKMVIYPMIFMFTVTIVALAMIVFTNISGLLAGSGGNVLLLLVATLLLALSVVLVGRSYKHLKA